MNAQFAEWRKGDRVWFIAEPNAESIVVEITGTRDGWTYRALKGSRAGCEPLCTERLVEITPDL